MATFQADGLTYHYTQSGRGPALLLLHGFTGSAQSWAPLMATLAGEYRLLALDLPGHGRSDAPADPTRYAMPAVARDIEALLDHLQIDAAHLLGYSMGGRLALYLALHQAVRWRTLILESASPGLATAEERAERVARDEALAEFIERRGIEAFVRRWEALPLFASQKRLPQARRQAHRAIRLDNRPQGLAGSLRGMGTGVQPSLWERLPELACLVLLVAGALDHKFVGIGQQMAERIPQARLEIVPGAGHTVHLEQPQRYAHLVREWLAKTAG